MRSSVVALCICMLALAGVAHAQYVVGDPVADFTLNDAYGTPVSLHEFENYVPWLVFWTDT